MAQAKSELPLAPSMSLFQSMHFLLGRPSAGGAGQPVMRTVGQHEHCKAGMGRGGGRALEGK